jgi:hypothetical protein
VPAAFILQLTSIFEMASTVSDHDQKYDRQLRYGLKNVVFFRASLSSILTFVWPSCVVFGVLMVRHVSRRPTSVSWVLDLRVQRRLRT